MDEPTAGLDPNQVRGVRKTMRRLAETKTILLSTHILQEVEAVADHVILIAGGRVVFDGQPAEMVAGHASMDEAFYKLTGEESPSPSPLAEDQDAESGEEEE